MAGCLPSASVCVCVGGWVGVITGVRTGEAEAKSSMAGGRMLLDCGDVRDNKR